MELLTDKELEAIEVSCKLAHLLKEIIGDGPQESGDNAERIMHIHAIQHMIMSQAAARAYPHRFRLLGGRK